jgi:hypothetical protein
MRKVREVLRLKHTLGMSLRQISEATGVGKTVVGEYVRRAGVIGITWPVPEAIDDAELDRRLFPVPCETGPPRAAIDWRKIHAEMKRRSVTLVLLWQEYRAEQADGMDTAASAISTANGARPSRRRCARRTRPGRGCSWIMPATRCRCSIK